MAVVPNVEQRRSEISKKLPNVLVADHIFFAYKTFLDRFRAAFNLPDDFYVETSQFACGERWLKVVVGDEGLESDLADLKRSRAIVPFWMSPQFGDEALVKRTVAREINALTHTERGRLPLVDEVMAVSPFIDLRQDKDGTGTGPNNREVGEANETTLIARDLMGADKLLLLGAHSVEGVDILKEVIPQVATVVPTPLFAEHIQTQLFQKGIIDPQNTRVVSLDKGSLQQCIDLSRQLDLPPENAIVSFDKNRKGHNMLGKLMLQYGDLTDMEGKDMIIYDDIVDTFGSLQETCALLKEKFKCKSITVVLTHGVLSHPARSKIVRSLNSNGKGPIIDRVIISNSLPKAKYAFEKIKDKDITEISVEKILGRIAKKFSRKSPQELLADPELQPYMFDLMPKELVWEDFKANIAFSERIHLPIAE
jgi:phosphoribosylpyrophosphate synthetase